MGHPIAKAARDKLKYKAFVAKVERINQPSERDHSIRTISRFPPIGHAWHPVHRANHDRLRSQRLRQASGTHTEQQWLARVAYYVWKCRYCGCDLTTETLVKEHQIPISRGGSNWPANLVPSCKTCNSKKHTMSPRVFLAFVAAAK